MQHEEFIKRVVELSVNRLPAEDREKCAAKIVYGSGLGMRGVRGITAFGAWKNGLPQALPIVEICASSEEGPIQVAGTTIHELGHVLAGHGHGHDGAWREACATLGLRAAKAAGMRYTLAALDPAIRHEVARMAILDGKPLNGTSILAPKPCSHGVGSRGGKSRGKGSGSRLRKWICACAPKPVIVRVSSDTFDATCNACGARFERGE